jgi:hypothetical protein
MANTYTAIQTVTVASSQNSIDFNNIPQTYSDLHILASLRGSGYNGTDAYLRFNSVASSYSTRFIYKDGNTTVPTSGNSSAQSAMFIGFGTGTNIVSGVHANASLYIPNYTSSQNKNVNIELAHENNNNDTWLVMVAGVWANSAAITSITLFPGSSGTWSANSSATLYGIKNS